MPEQLRHQKLAKLNLQHKHTWGLQRFAYEDSPPIFKWIPIAPITSLLEKIELQNAPKFVAEPEPMGMDFFPGNYAIYKAYEPQMERLVLLKIAAPENGEINEDASIRLENEFKVLKNADHPGLPKVYELISTQLEFIYSLTRVDKKDIPILVMELLEGPRLDYELGSLSSDQIIRIAGEMASTIDYLNLRLGQPHGDLKSANVILASEHSKIIDLGNTNGGLFSTYYSAPELANSNKPDHASDIYSYAVVVYEMLRNAIPFQIEYDKDKGLEVDPATNRVYKPLSVENCARLGLDQNQVAALNILFKKAFTLPDARPKTAEQFFQEFQAILN